MNLSPLNKHLHLDSALERLMNDDALLLEVLGMMVTEFQGEIEAIKQQESAANFEWLTEKGRYYKGIAANLSATRFQELAQQIEHEAAANNKAPLKSLIDQLALESAEIERAIQTIRG